MIVLALLLAALLALNAAYCVVRVRADGTEVGIWPKLWGIVSAATALMAALFLVALLGIAHAGV
jgi:hypothetical protein